MFETMDIRDRVPVFVRFRLPFSKNLEQGTPHVAETQSKLSIKLTRKFVPG